MSLFKIWYESRQEKFVGTKFRDGLGIELGHNYDWRVIGSGRKGRQHA